MRNAQSLRIKIILNKKEKNTMIKELKQGIVHLKPDITLEHLKVYEGKNVCVFYSVAGNDRNGFMTTVSVYGELEIHPDNDENYRVLVDKDIYAYFSLSDVGMIAQTNGKRANIALRCEQK
jgi:hypothetical protein